MLRSSILISAALFTAMLLLSPFNTSAQAGPEQVGIVVAARGDVVAVNSSGDSRKLTIKSPVFREDTIRTGKRGRVQLMFTDNTLISLDRQTEMKIAEYEWKPEDKDGKLKTEIKEGTFRVMGGKITKVAPDKFTTETPAATIGIRGSMYAGKVAGDSLSVVFQGGKGITVTNEFGSILITKPGYGTNVTIDEPPAPPAKFTAEDLSGLNEQSSDSNSDEQSDDTAVQNGDDNSGTDDSVSSEQSDDSQAETSSAEQTGDDQTEASAEDSGTGDSETFLALTDDSSSSTTTDNTLDGGTSSTSPQVVVEISPTDQGPLKDTPLDTSNPYQSVVERELSLQNLPTAPSTVAPPSNGVESYKGIIAGSGTDPDGNQVAISGEVALEVNWYTKKVLGRVMDKNSEGQDQPVYFFGDVVGNQITNIKILGPGGDHASLLPSIISGTSPYASFYGPSQDAFGLYGAGTEYLITTLASQGDWTVTGTGQSTGIDPLDVTAPTGNDIIFQGFMVGAAEDVTDPGLNRRLYMNDSSSLLTLHLNRDAGTLYGSASVTSGSSTLDLAIGGGNGSVYVLDDNFIGLASGTVTNGGTASLKPYFNYLVTADPDKQDWFFGRGATASEYASWGYWEAAYVDPQSGKTYHSHIPYSTWVAGELTSYGYMTTTSAPLATYKGGALGFHTLADGRAFDLGKGTSSFDVTFTGSGANVTNGKIYFPASLEHSAVDIRFDPMSFTDNTYHDYNTPPTQPINAVNGAEPNASEVNAAFYGDAAQEFGGNFNADMGSDGQYKGVFGASK